MPLEKKQTRMNLSGSQTAACALLMKNFHESGKRAYKLFP
jgi:hypothetical protein